MAKAIRAGMQHLLRLQTPQGHWGNPDDPHAMGHTSLPLLALLKGGTSPDAEPVQRAFARLRTMSMTSTYGVGCYLMAIHARYAPQVGGLDTDVGEDELAAPDPDEIAARLTEEDRKALEGGLDYLVRAQVANGLWRYHLPPNPRSNDHDLSNTQYALLGLRAAADCGLDVPFRVWKAALDGIYRLQDREGEKVDLLDYRIKEGYALKRKVRAEARGFRYTDGMKNGPLGENTVPVDPTTGSMTTAGIASILICREGMWSTRRFRGQGRRKSEEAVRDGLAWLQEHFTVEHNPGLENAHHLYYLYGLERAGMLAGRRWLGTHDWYKEGADLLLGKQDSNGAWGDHTLTSFAILFLKRATKRTRDTPVVTGK